MLKVGQGILAVLAGCVVATIAIGVAETLGRAIFPPALDLSKPMPPEQFFAAIRPGGFAFILLGCALGTFIGSSVASKFAPRYRLAVGMVVGGLMLANFVANMARFPHPLWVRVVGVLLFLPMSFLGATLGSIDTDRTPQVEPDPA